MSHSALHCPKCGKLFYFLDSYLDWLQAIFFALIVSFGNLYFFEVVESSQVHTSSVKWQRLGDYSLSAFNFECIYVFGTDQGGLFFLAYINFKSGRLKNGYKYRSITNLF